VERAPEDAFLKLHGSGAAEVESKELLPFRRRARGTRVQVEGDATVLRKAMTCKMGLTESDDPRHSRVLTAKQVPDRGRDRVKVERFNQRIEESLEGAHPGLTPKALGIESRGIE
jgi:hypothetical protein